MGIISAKNVHVHMIHLHTKALHTHHVGLGWGGVPLCANTVQVPLHTQALHTDHVHTQAGSRQVAQKSEAHKPSRVECLYKAK
jgi:hypothetical protein